MTAARLKIYGLLAALLLSPLPGPAAAHPGHDDPEPVVSMPGAPRAQAASQDFELVVVLVAAEHRLRVYLDTFATNQPIPNATLDIADGGGETVRAEPQSDGAYSLAAPWLEKPGRHDLTITVTAGDQADLLTATIEIPALAAPPAGNPAEDTLRARASAGLRHIVGDRKAGVAIALAFLLGVLSVLMIQARGIGRAIMGGMVVALGVLTAGVALAQGAVDSGPAVAPAPSMAAPDVPRRQPDGAVSMPKDTQRLLAIRTMLAESATASRAIQIIGQVIPDPSASGRVQSSQPGRIEAGEAGLAHIGMRVKAGDILAVLAPAIATLERGAAGAQVADIEQQLRVAEQRVTRLSALAGSVAGKEIDDARAELAGARARRAAMSNTLAGREILRAPTSGIVSTANAVIGQFVEGRDILFEIVDPARLWIDATGFDPALAGELRGAAAMLTDGTPLPVELVGRGLALRQGATPLLFRITAPPPGITVGAPVSVIVRVATDAVGIALPRAAVVRLPNGGAAVWDHVSAEIFVPRPVRLQPLDGAYVLILAGLKPGQRIVTQGGDLLNQVR